MWQTIISIRRYGLRKIARRFIGVRKILTHARPLSNNILHFSSMILLSAFFVPCSIADTDDGIEAVSYPSADVILSFVQPGRVAEVIPAEGDAVTKDQILVRLDDSVERVRLDMLRAQSEVKSQIDASRATLEQRQLDLEKLKWAFERGASTDQEVAHASLDVRIAKLGLDIAEFEHKQSGRDYKAEKIRVDGMTMKSPIDGIVERIEVETGESVNSLQPVTRIVRIDPLWADVHVALQQAIEMKRDDEVQVIFPDAPDDPVTGRVAYVASVADAGSSTLRIRIEVPNENKRPAGQHIRVNLSK
jgi:RND family efflux transporter MFP subunit